MKQKIDQLSEFCKVMSKDTEEIVGGEGKEQSITMNKESANLINCIYDSSLKTFAVTIKEKMKVEKSDFNCDGEVLYYLNSILSFHKDILGQHIVKCLKRCK